MSELNRRKHGEETVDFLGGEKNKQAEAYQPNDVALSEDIEGAEVPPQFSAIRAKRDTNKSEYDEAVRTESSAERNPARSASGSQRKSVRNSQQKSARNAQKNASRNAQQSSGSGVWNVKLLIVLAVAVIVAVVIIISGIGVIVKGKGNTAGVNTPGGKPGIEQSKTALEDASGALEEDPEGGSDIIEVNAFSEAKLLAAQYDYDAAIELLKNTEDFSENNEAQAAVKEYEEIKSTLVEQNIYEIPHIFFHILCVDPKNSFNESKWGKQAGGYNALMTTVDEFKKMMNELYDKGYVLVSIRDIAREERSEDGTVKMKAQSIMLPPGKKAFVMSEDDVCYYEYMKGAGFADRIIIGDDGRPTTHYTDGDGNEHVGEYDIVPVLDSFIDEHPDFSYKGHKACLVFTGYNGILGYRTDESYDPSSEYYDSKLEQGHDVEAERKKAVEVLKALHEDGYDLGSHSWGHRDLGEIDMERFKKDCDRWNRNVAPLIKEATGAQPDIIIFPRGADIGDWHPYTSDNARFNYMHRLGFRYFCNVDNNKYWVQIGDTYMRQGRRALDGYNMWLQISGQNSRLSDLFDDVPAIFDKARPTPVPSYF